MPLSYEVRSLYRFGVVELDAHTGELRRNGIKLKLPGIGQKDWTALALTGSSVRLLA